MAYVIADTGFANQKLYAFYPVQDEEQINWNLVSIVSTNYDHDGSILLTAETLRELQEKNVAIFESKKSAKAVYHKLGIPNCRYVRLILSITHEFKTRNGSYCSSWTDLNSKV
ncbi:hypothetical protein CG015_17150 [Vibrio anguillarum]|uniref:Uncharacterized protein n=1 Tax=Vibrio anguillarum TaxID=55601 RepID=A0AAW4BFX1_VIBAN|nr:MULTISPECIES: hypothetical protein [Vibrio]ASO30947.1 hypothetical protein CG015_17150 [Vibrio anguillarum]MBF4376515.1 hypothetical protein [Vibrio anguillarum]MBF4435936.1 hypothetical protein [Vibrio anguillarum]MBY7669107.1 hypothetical protein [Vibrio anguillarum]MCR9422692.1 hypothetical protein [Vibrio sp. RM-69-4]